MPASTDVVGAVGVAVPAVFDDGNVDVDDVAVFQDLLLLGMPWQMTWLTEVQVAPGKGGWP